MRKKFALIATLLIAILMLVPSVSAITFGQPDNGEHPYVGTLLFVQNGVGYYSCSGTLISPTVMLTAGHCVEEAGNTNDVTYVRFEEDAMAGYAEAKSLDQWLKKNWIEAKAVIPHPMYDDFSQFPATYDVGLVILSKPVHMSTYGQLPSLGFLESSVSPQDTFTAVGYGMQGYVPAFYADIYARYKGTVSLVELKSNSAGGHSAKFTNNPGVGNGSGGTCFGDSGGPVFYQNTNMVTAVVSWGITPCIGVDYQFRVDTSIALDFIYQHLR